MSKDISEYVCSKHCSHTEFDNSIDLSEMSDMAHINCYNTKCRYYFDERCLAEEISIGCDGLCIKLDNCIEDMGDCE